MNMNKTPKRTKLRIFILVSLMLMISQMTFAYVTLPSTQYSIKIGETKFLSVPSATRGYIDKAIWTCSNPNIKFIKKDNAGAQVKITSSFSGTTIIELVCVEKYNDKNNRTQAITYYKQFKISCISTGTVAPTSISFPKIQVKIGEQKTIKPTVRPSNATVIYKSCTLISGNSASIWIDSYSNVIKAIGRRPGITTSEIVTTNGKKAIVLKDNDELISVRKTTGENEILIGASNGRMVRFNENEIRVMGRSSSGVKGISFENSYVVGAEVVNKAEDVLIVTEKGYGKKTNVDQYRLTHRGSKGVKALNVTEKNGNLVSLKTVKGDEDLLIITNSGIIIRIDTQQISTLNRNTQGIRLINLKDNQKVSTVALVEKEIDSPDESEDNN